MPRLTQIRIGALEELASQLRFAPAPTVLRQVRNIQALAAEIDPASDYPEDWIVFRVTGYRADIDAPALLPGAALLGELSALAEHISDAARLGADDLDAPSLTIDALARRWSVSRRTIERYRRRGLIGFRAVDDDGAVRVRFDETAVGAFELRHPDLLASAAARTRITPAQRERILARARALHDTGRARTRSEAARLIATEVGRSTEAVRLVLRADAPDRFAVRTPLPAARRRALLDAYDAFEDIASIAAGAGRSRASAWRVINEMRLDRLRALQLHALVQGIEFDESDVDRALKHEACTARLRDEPANEARAWIEAARAEPPMDADAERARSTAMHALIARAERIVTALPRVCPSSRALDEAETALRWAALLRARLACSARGVALRAIEDRLGAPLLDLPADDIRAVHSAAMRAVLVACDRFAPGARAARAGRFAARASIAVERAIAGMAASLRAPRGARRTGTTPVTLDTWWRPQARWMTWLDLPDDAIKRARRPGTLDPALARALHRRYALDGHPPATLAATRAELRIGPHALRRAARSLTRD